MDFDIGDFMETVKVRVLLVFGGVSSEHEVSRNSAFSILSNLDKNKYEIITVGITKDGRWLLTEADFEDIKTGKWENHCENKSVTLSLDKGKNQLILIENSGYTVKNIHCIWSVLHGKNGEDGTIQGLCQLADVACVGPDVCSSAICIDKVYTKLLADSMKLKQGQYIFTHIDQYEGHETAFIDKINDSFNQYPLFVKPARAGSSVGITKVSKESDLLNAIKTAFMEDSKIVVEEFIRGREIEVAVLGNENPKVSCLGEIVPDNDWYDYHTKYGEKSTKLIIPAEIDKPTTKAIQEKAVDIYKKFGCRGLSRIDFFLTENNEIFFNEINTMPGFTEASMYPQLWEHSGLTYSKLLDEIIKYALNR